MPIHNLTKAVKTVMGVNRISMKINDAPTRCSCMSKRSYYIASSLKNVDQVRELKKVLDAAGWRHTYDWTVHGSVQREGFERIAEVAAAESQGVCEADVVIVLLPGGRGTHTELGMAIGLVDAVAWAPGQKRSPRIAIYSPDPEKDFGTGGTTCAFYHHPCVERFSDMDELHGWLAGAL